jgi:hypothetical protein
MTIVQIKVEECNGNKDLKWNNANTWTCHATLQKLMIR